MWIKSVFRFYIQASFLTLSKCNLFKCRLFHNVDLMTKNYFVFLFYQIAFIEKDDNLDSLSEKWKFKPSDVRHLEP